MSLHRRVQRLEVRRACLPSGPCRVCGHGSGSPIKLSMKLSLEPFQRGIKQDTSPRPEDFCAGCGRQWRFRMGAPAGVADLAFADT